MFKRKWMSVIGVVSAISAMGVAVSLLGASAPRADEQVHTLAVPTESAKPVVRAQLVGDKVTLGERSYTGVVKARYQSNLAFRVGGKIIGRHIEVGQRISPGTLLFSLDPIDYQLAVKAAEADRAAAEAEVAQTLADEIRIRALHGRKVSTLADLEKAEALRDTAIGRRDRAKENLTLSQNRLSYCDLRADGEGVILTLPAEIGQVVADGQVVASMARAGEREAVVDLPENQAHHAQAAIAAVSLWSAPGEKFSATLREMSPIADPMTRTYQARFTVNDPESKLLLGMTATVHLSPAGRLAGFVVPLSSLTHSDKGPAVWIANESTGALTRQPVAVAEYQHETVVLSDGLQKGQWVVTAGVQKLDPSLNVRLWEGSR